MMALTASLAVMVLAANPPVVLDAVVETRLDSDLRCRLGVYRLPQGRFLTITGDSGHPRNLQYSRSDGAIGRLVEASDGGYAARPPAKLTARFGACASGEVRLEGPMGTEIGKRLPLVVRETTFKNGDVRLQGKLVLPPNAKARALAVWIGGSNNNPETDDLSWSYELARRGVGVFVYDKRGVGGSGGAMSTDVYVRAADTVAAVQEARRLTPGIARVGVMGASQGGWVAPLVAAKVPLDFMVGASAMAEGMIAQDKAVVAEQLRRARYNDTVLRQAAALTAATEQVVRSGFTEGYDALDALKAQYGAEPWFQAIQPRSYTGILIRMTSAEIRAQGPTQARGWQFTYDPRPLVETIGARQLWLLGGADRQVPRTETLPVLEDIQRSRPDLDIVIFPDADHGLIEPVQRVGGESYAFSPGLFDLLADWIKRGRVIAPPTVIVQRGR